jgi:hypothetical protein
MRKKNLKSLRLNKKPVSSLNTIHINGGAINISELIGCITGPCRPDKITDHCVPTTSCPPHSESCYPCWD